MKDYKAKLTARLRPAKFQIGEFVRTPDGEGLVLGIRYLTPENIEYLVQVIDNEDEDIAASFAFWWTEDALS